MQVLRLSLTVRIGVADQARKGTAAELSRPQLLRLFLLGHRPLGRQARARRITSGNNRAAPHGRLVHHGLVCSIAVSTGWGLRRACADYDNRAAARHYRKATP
jgi:hypothetical protein